MKRILKASKRTKKSGRADHLNDHQTKRNGTTNAIRNVILQGCYPSDPKTFWKLTKYVTKQSTSIPILKNYNGNTIQDDTRKLNF